MSSSSHVFVGWEEHILCHERGNRVVHFCVKDASGESILAVIGTERSIRHMVYVVSDGFMQAHGANVPINAGTKWRARRDVVEWLKSIVSKDSEMSDISQGFGSLQVSGGTSTHQSYLPDQMVQRKLKVQNSEIEWSGIDFLCAKQLKHYPSFCRNEITIAVHSFVFIMSEEDGHHIGYIEDMYEDKKGQKKVKVRWFHHNQEVIEVLPDLNPHPHEVFITPDVQVISAECIDGVATVLTPKHFEECMAIGPDPDDSPSGVYMCHRQLKNNKVKLFSLTKLRGYSNQVILASLDASLALKSKKKSHSLTEEAGNKESSLHDDRLHGKRSRSCRDEEGVRIGSGPRNSVSENQLPNPEQTFPKLKLKLSRKTMGGGQSSTRDLECLFSYKVNEKIEVLSQDSGMRGCWFRCKILRVTEKKLKVRYDDVENAAVPGKLEEWIAAPKVANPDKLGMRYPGRQVIRPFPPVFSTDGILQVGAAVDAWWCDGWWEGVVIEVVKRGKSLQVYFPGEDRFLKVMRKHIRTSKDWDGNQWVDIKAKADIISYLSANAIRGMKLPKVSNLSGMSSCGSSMSVEQNKVLTGSKLESVKEDLQEVPISLAFNEKDLNLQMRSHADDKNNTTSASAVDENKATAASVV